MLRFSFHPLVNIPPSLQSAGETAFVMVQTELGAEANDNEGERQWSNFPKDTSSQVLRPAIYFPYRPSPH